MMSRLIGVHGVYRNIAKDIVRMYDGDETVAEDIRGDSVTV